MSRLWSESFSELYLYKYINNEWVLHAKVSFPKQHSELIEKYQVKYEPWEKWKRFHDVKNIPQQQSRKRTEWRWLGVMHGSDF